MAQMDVTDISQITAEVAYQFGHLRKAHKVVISEPLNGNSAFKGFATELTALQKNLKE